MGVPGMVTMQGDLPQKSMFDWARRTDTSQLSWFPVDNSATYCDAQCRHSIQVGDTTIIVRDSGELRVILSTQQKRREPRVLC